MLGAIVTEKNKRAPGLKEGTKNDRKVAMHRADRSDKIPAVHRAQKLHHPWNAKHLKKYY